MNRTRGGRGSAGKGRGGYVWMGVLVALAVFMVTGFAYLKGISSANAADKETGCLTSGKVPQAVLFMVDATDQLSPETAKRVVSVIRDEAEQLPQYSRLIVVPFGDDVAAPFEPMFNACLPGTAKDARLDQSPRFVQEAHDKFLNSLDRLSEKLQGLHDSRTSPITAQIVKAASDPLLHWKGEQKTLVLLSDGLESSIYWTRNLQLKTPPKGILDDVRVEYFELGNEKAARLQSDQMRQQWKNWFESAGASVRMTAPGYSAT